MRYWLLFLSLLGLADSAYLTYEHFSNSIPPCTTAYITLVDCGRVLKSSYAYLFGVPLAVLGLFHYSLLTIWLLLALRGNKAARYLMLLQTIAGFGFSVYFVYLQLVVIQAICVYCMVSALTSTLLFFFVWNHFVHERKALVRFVIGSIYRNFMKPILFLFNPETVHVSMVRFGELFGSVPIVKRFLSWLLVEHDARLQQAVAGITFTSPVGLAAGFDYEARLTETLSGWGFGFQTVGTITNSAYEGNPRPMLGRLPKSKSLMVNKGFKNPGAYSTIVKLLDKHFEIPVGISIGRTNSRTLTSQKQSVADIVSAFKRFELSVVPHAYYELNISCPNLYGSVEFYSKKNLTELLNEVDKLKLSRPVFVKMPSDKNDKEFLQILETISTHSPVGVIVSNLQKNRQDPALDPTEVAQFKTGNFSGKATYKDSNRLIKLAYTHYKKRFVIIGCGGVFSAEDAWEKITNGATLIQLITGMIYEGPQVVAEISAGLAHKLTSHGYAHISEAVGTAV